MSGLSYALEPSQLLRSIDASRDTLGKARMKLIDVVDEVSALTGGAPYAVVGGLAQILWARKTHTDDLDVVLATGDLARAHSVHHLVFQCSVVDLLSYRNEAFTAEILATALPVAELHGIRFARPELLLVTQLLRPGPVAALAAVELVLARREKGGLDLDYTTKWALQVDRSEGLRRTLARADELARNE